MLTTAFLLVMPVVELSIVVRHHD